MASFHTQVHGCRRTGPCLIPVILGLLLLATAGCGTFRSGRQPADVEGPQVAYQLDSLVHTYWVAEEERWEPIAKTVFQWSAEGRLSARTLSQRNHKQRTWFPIHRYRYTYAPNPPDSLASVERQDWYPPREDWATVKRTRYRYSDTSKTTLVYSVDWRAGSDAVADTLEKTVAYYNDSGALVQQTDYRWADTAWRAEASVSLRHNPQQRVRIIHKPDPRREEAARPAKLVPDAKSVVALQADGHPQKRTHYFMLRRGRFRRWMPSWTETYSFDARGRDTMMVHRNAQGKPTHRYRKRYDAHGNVTQRQKQAYRSSPESWKTERAERYTYTTEVPRAVVSLPQPFEHGTTSSSVGMPELFGIPFYQMPHMLRRSELTKARGSSEDQARYRARLYWSPLGDRVSGS
jgi:hypothetical protein